MHLNRDKSWNPLLKMTGYTPTFKVLKVFPIWIHQEIFNIVLKNLAKGSNETSSVFWLVGGIKVQVANNMYGQ